MPTYDYYSPVADRTVEVLHSMSTTVKTWGELCERAGIEPGDVPLDSPVERCLPSAAPYVSTGAASPRSAAPKAGGCGHGTCGCHG